MQNIVTAGNRYIAQIQQGSVTRITSDAHGVGQIYYGNNPNGPRGPAIGANADMLFGPFVGTAKLMIDCPAGTFGTITVESNYQPAGTVDGLPPTIAEATGTAALIDSRLSEAQRTAINALDPATATVETIVQALQA